MRKKDSVFDRMNGRHNTLSTKTTVLIIGVVLLVSAMLVGLYMWIGLTPIVVMLLVVFLGITSFQSLRKNKQAFITDIREGFYTILIIFMLMIAVSIFNKDKGEENPSHTKTGFAM